MFTTKKGRPPKPKAKPDRKLVEKKLMQSMEALDFLHKKSLITEQEQWAGVHLRWLYGLRFGAPSINAVDYEEYRGRDLNLNDPVWQEAREKEYGRAIMELRVIKAHKLVLNVAVFNQMPKFIMSVDSFKNEKKAIENHNEFRIITEGLDLLCKIWGRDNDRRNF